MPIEAKREFTTGQVSGITWTSPPTLYRYVRDFPQFFSPSARKHTKGRRWTLDDLDTIQAIRTLHHSRTGHDKTIEILTSGWRPAINSEAEREQYSRVAEELFKIAEQTKEKLTNHQVSHDFISDRITHEIKSIYEMIAELQVRVQQLENKRGLFERWSRPAKPVGLNNQDDY